MSKKINEEGMPIAITLDPGTYFRCTCGGSQHLPFCDGSHPSGEQGPTRFELKERAKVFLCGCGRTETPPFCDEQCGVQLDKEI